MYMIFGFVGIECVGVFLDVVVVVIIMLMVLELKILESVLLSVFGLLWLMVVSYVVSYLFIVIVWVNYYYLLWFVCCIML